MKWFIRVIVFVATAAIGFGIAKFFDAIEKPWTAATIYACSIVTVSIVDHLIQMRQDKQSTQQRI